MHSPKKFFLKSTILCVTLRTQRCITDKMITQEAYLVCSKHCATFPLKQTIRTAAVAQVLPLVLVVKISVTELSSTPPPHPLCFLQDSWTVSHDQSNHPPTECETSCAILVSDTAWKKNAVMRQCCGIYNKWGCVDIQLVRVTPLSTRTLCMKLLHLSVWQKYESVKLSFLLFCW